MILPVFITVISDHDKPQPPGCLLGVEVEKIAIEISFKRGRRISDSGFVQYLIKKYKSQAMKELIHGADIPDE
ncbi:hypothetical protein [Escherichia coli]|uniref:hypothetical protein n=1 Tax=Escherichia coli TaxID=562 RepID=UPI0023EAB268|nr:hypothetical protein [Escherichia coli]